jgi:hypothetical protein
MLQNSAPRLLRTAAVLAVLAGLWGGAAWLGRDVRPRAIEWTGPAFAICLVATYLGIWCCALIWARERRPMLFRAVATTALILILVLILESAAFFGLVDFDRLFRQLAGEGSGPATNFIEDQDLAFRRPPDSVWSGRPRSDMAELWNLPMRPRQPLTFTFDSRGFRNLTERDRADIVLIGDSYVEGHYVDDRETVAVALEELTGRTVVNLGQSGYGTLQELEILRRFGLALQPEMVAWFFFEGNDLYDDQEFENSVIYLREHGTFETAGANKLETDENGKRDWRGRWGSFRKASFSYHAFRMLRRMGHSVVPNGTPEFGWFQEETGRHHRLYFYDYAQLRFTDYEQERFAVTQEALLSARRECEDRGVRLVVFFIPMKFRVYADHCTFPPHSPCREWTAWDLADRFADFCEAAEIDFVDLTRPMRAAAATGRLLYAPEDSHWNAAGHRFVAEQIQEAW